MLVNIDGVKIAELTEHDAALTSAGFRADGSFIVTTSYDGTAHLWDADGKSVRVLEASPRDVLSAAFRPDAAQVVTGGGGGTLLWDIGGKLVASLDTDVDRVLSVISNPSGTHVLSIVCGTWWEDDCNGRALARLWGTEGNALTSRNEASSESETTTEGQTEASVDDPSEVTWADAAGQRVLVSRRVKEGEESYHLSVQLWDLAGRTVAELEDVHGVYEVFDNPRAALSPDGSRIVSFNALERPGLGPLVGRDGKLITSLQRTGQRKGQSAVFSADSQRIMMVVRTGEGAQLASDTRQTGVYLWDPEGRPIRMLVETDMSNRPVSARTAASSWWCGPTAERSFSIVTGTS